MLVLIGAILAAIGVTFTLQGLNVLKGSGMSDQTQWAVIGPVIAVVGVAVLVYGWRRPPPDL
jgi:drug/metabolite transporter superfamily protein YnfA